MKTITIQGGAIHPPVVSRATQRACAMDAFLFANPAWRVKWYVMPARHLYDGGDYVTHHFTDIRKTFARAPANKTLRIADKSNETPVDIVRELTSLRDMLR